MSEETKKPLRTMMSEETKKPSVREALDDWREDSKLRRERFEKRMAEIDAQAVARKAESAEKAKELEARTKISVVKLSLQIFAGFLGIAAISIGHFGWLWGIVFTLSNIFLIHGAINLTGLMLARGLLSVSQPEEEDE